MESEEIEDAEDKIDDVGAPLWQLRKAGCSTDEEDLDIIED